MAQGQNVGSLQSDRSAVEPSYLLNGDIGFNGGGTSYAGDPERMMQQYENVFGPAAREIKWDAQRHKRHQRWHLPDSLKGSNVFLTDRIDGLITDATTSPFTKNILPYYYMENPDQKIKWNVYSFDEGMASRVPYESAARVLPQSKRSFAGYAVRHGLAIAMEHNFMMSPQGMENFRRQLLQLVGSIQLTNDLDVHMALLYAPSYQKTMDEKYWDGSKTLTQMCRMYVDLFGFVQKNENALDYLIEDAKNHLTQWGGKPPTFMLTNGALTRQLTMTPERTNYITAGPDGKRKLAQGPDLPSYRGVNIINTRQFSLESGAAPRDMLRRRVRVSEHYRIAWEPSNLDKRYEFYDQSRDSMSWQDLYKASFPALPEENFFEIFESLKPLQFHNNEDFTADGYTDPLFVHNGNPTALATAAENGTLRDLMFNANEIRLCALLGIWSPAARDATVDKSVNFLQDLEFACRVHNAQGACNFRAATATLHQSMINKNLLYHVLAMACVKLYIKDKFPTFYTNQGEDNINQILTVIGFNGADPTIHTFVAYIYQMCLQADFTASNAHLVRAWSLFPPNDRSNTTVMCLATDLFLLRPNIEHYMLGIILGRGGGPEELGATFWGQTELSCYDDAQHGIWGMSYKYHERAMVINEKNLIRVFDVCFDGYCGGNDARIMNWSKEGVEEFRTATTNLTTAYTGPSMVVMALPRYKNVFSAFPNPLVWHPYVPDATRLRTHPDRGGTPSTVAAYCPFAHSEHNTDQQLRHSVYSMYYQALGLQSWNQLQTPLDPGHAAYSNETDPYVFSFQGHMTSIWDGNREETHGSGHLGSNFVGVASVREGRGMLPRGKPMLAHLV